MQQFYLSLIGCQPLYNIYMETTSDTKKIAHLYSLLRTFSRLGQSPLRVPATPPLSVSTSAMSSSSTKSNQSIDSQIKEKLKKTFYRHYQQYKDTGMTHNYEGMKLLHISVVKQIWFDCYLCTMKQYKKLITPIKQYSWLDFRKFCQSVGTLAEVREKPLLNMTKPKNKLKLERSKANWLFFFCISLNNSKQLRKDSLVEVLSVSLGKTLTPEQVLSLVNVVRNDQDEESDYITLQDFKRSISC